MVGLCGGQTNLQGGNSIVDRDGRFLVFEHIAHKVFQLGDIGFLKTLEESRNRVVGDRIFMHYPDGSFTKITEL